MSALRLSVCLLVAAFVGGSQARGKDTDEFYQWVEFDGEIPPDAVPAGTSVRGTQIYIGHTIHKYVDHTGTTVAVIVPGQIDEVDKKIYYAYDKVLFGETKNTKILCSPYPERFRWLKTNTQGIRFLRQKHLVQGGADDGYPLLIGRVFNDGKTAVGKVTLYHKSEGMDYVDVESDKVSFVKSFDVLSYNDRCS